MDRRRYRLGMCVCTFLVACVVTLSAAAADQTAQVRQIIQASGLKDTVVSICAVDLTTGQTLIEINADEPMTPASNMKLVTTAAALDILGPDFVFQTLLQRVEPGPGEQGVKLLIKGDGDPAFGDPELLKKDNLSVEDLLNWWVQGVKEAGIRSVDSLIVDDRVFDQQFVHQTWPDDQLDKWWCAQVSGLCFYDNTLDIVPEPTTPGQAPRVRIMPEAPFLTTVNRATTSNADTFWISRKIGTNELTYWGKVKSKRTTAIAVTVHDAPVLFAQILSHRLALAGVPVKTIQRQGIEDRPLQMRTLRTVQSTLPLVLTRCNQDSQNLFAEALIKRMGYAFTGAAGSWDNGAAAVRQAMRNRLGARAVAIKVVDGSGMSRDNQVTSRSLVELLKSMHTDSRLWPVFRDSLSLGGANGTLERRFADRMAGTVHGKSGYLNGVSSLSGYLIIPSGNGQANPDNARVIAFSCLFNGFKPPLHNGNMKAVQDQIVRLLDKQYAPAPTKSAAVNQ